jgi:hypothetical protein
MRAGGAAIAVLMIAAGLGTGCPSAGAFECIDEGDCDRADMGVCMNGACAYPSTECGSGLAWSPNAASDPGACVEEPVGTTGTTTTTTTTSSSSSETGSGSSITADATSSGPIPACGFRMAIEIDTGLLSPTTSLVDYPLLLSLTDDALAEQDATTMFFAAEDGAALPHDLESFEAATGSLVAWVRLPEWTVGEPLTLLLSWGDPAAVPELQAGDVWATTYVGVWHLGDELDDSEGEVVRNAVPGGGHGFAFGAVGGEQSVPGMIGAALLFDGSDDYVEVDAPFVGSLQTFTVSYWSRWDGATEEGGYFSRLNGEHLYPRCWRVDGAGSPFCQLHSVDTTVGVGGDSEDVAPGELVHMAFSWDGEVATTYFDGVVGRTNAMYPGMMPLGGTNPMLIGRGWEFGTFNGLLDEFRVSDRALPPEWIEADFRTQSNPGNAILAVGDAEARPCE